MDQPTDQDIFSLSHSLNEKELLMLFSLRQGMKSQAQVCRDLHCSPRTARRMAASLREKGMLVSSRGDYSLVFPWPDIISTFGVGHGELAHSKDEVKEKPERRDQTGSVVQETMSVLQDSKETIVQAESSIVPGPREGVIAQDSSSLVSEDLQFFPPDALQIPPEASTDATGPEDLSSLQDLAQDASSDLAGNDEKSSDEPEIDPAGNGNETSESYFDDARLDLLVAQIEGGRKLGTRLWKWFKAENLLTYWPPTDSYRVEKTLLRQKAKTLDELNSILTAPVRPEYDWFVTSFLEGCRDNGYEPEDTSQVFALEINMLLDAMLRPARQGKGLWTAESIRVQLKTMIEEWAKLKTWTQLGLPFEQPSEPALEFFITNTAVWQAAREKWIDEKDAKILTVLQRWESDRNDRPATAIG